MRVTRNSLLSSYSTPSVGAFLTRRFSSASSPTRSLTFGRWGCGERCHLSHVIGDSAVVLLGMSRQIALQTLSEALRCTKRVLNALRAWKARKTLTEALRRSGAPIPLSRGFQVARNRVSPLQSPFARYRQPRGW